MKTAVLFLVLLVPLAVISACSIESNRPAVDAVSIPDGSVIADVDSFTSIDITFSKPMNRYATESNIGISGYAGAFHFRWGDGNRTVTLLLDDPLERGNVYVLAVGGNCECEEGYDLGEDVSRTVYTYSVRDEFTVLSTTPADGETVSTLDSLVVSLVFSLPVDETTLYDKITLDPGLAYRYSLSPDRRTIELHIAEHVRANKTYTLTVSEKLSALQGRRLSDTYRFSFDTKMSGSPFALSGATMVQAGIGSPGIGIDIGYLGTTAGVEKEMDLLLHFNGDFHLRFVEDYLSVEPAIPYRLVKEGSSLRLVFGEAMASGGSYRITVQKALANSFGVQLDREYRFTWIVDGPGSRDLSVLQVRIENPDISDLETVIYENGRPVHNRAMLLRNEEDNCFVDFTIFLSSALDVYRSLDGITLPFRYGNSAGASGTLVHYDWEPSDRSLRVTFDLSPIDEGGDAYYKLVLSGGAEGFVDRRGNFMEETIEIYVVYKVAM